MVKNNNIYFPAESPVVVVVEASAGSGKTYALSKRFIQLLINPQLDVKQIPLKSILAITFTNKAAFEMKERILDILKRIAFDDFWSAGQKKDIYTLLGTTPEHTQKKACYIMEYIISQYSFFGVKTIDSFINALLSGCAFGLNRSAHFKIKRDYGRYFSYCLDLLIEKANHSPKIKGLFDDFLSHYLLVENQKSWFPKENILSLMVWLFRLSNSYNGEFSEYKVKTDDLLTLKSEVYKQIEDLALCLPPGINKTAQKSINKFLDENRNYFNLSSLPSKLEIPQIPMNKNQSAPEPVAEKWKDLHCQIKRLVDIEAVCFYNSYIRLFKEFTKIFGSVLKQDDILFLEELNYKAQQLFSDGGLTVPELYYRLACRFRHYLIDEFQDTSLLQWINLYPMIEEALSVGGSLFYVGDKKQAIYRFRGGDSGLFDRVRTRLSSFNVHSYSLEKNWRSHKEIVLFNNQIFSRENIENMLCDSGISDELALTKEAIREITSRFKDTQQAYKEDKQAGFVKVERLSEDNVEKRNEVLKEKVLNLIAQLEERFLHQEIAILARDNSEVELITSWLLEKDIPAESDKTLNLLQNNTIREIIAFLRFLYSPIDNISFSAFILGDVFSRGTGLKNQEIHDFLFKLRKVNKEKNKQAVTIYTAFREEYKAVWDSYISDFFKNVGFISAYELLVSIYQRFDLMNTFPDQQAFFMKLLDLLKSKEAEFIGLNEFIYYLDNAPSDDLYVGIGHTDSVKVLTIHKSKGLEFSVVIIPFLHMDLKPELSAKNSAIYIDNTRGQKLGLVRGAKPYRTYSDRVAGIYRRAYKDCLIDELNNIYVGCTRAECELYIFIPKKSGNGMNKASFLFPAKDNEYGKRIKYTRKKMAEETAFINIPFPEYKDWVWYLQDEFTGTEPIKNRQKILEGEIMHFVLSFVGDCSNENLDRLIEKALNAAKIKFGIIDNGIFYAGRIKVLLNNNSLRKVFFTKDSEVFCEKEVVNAYGDTKRIDRIIVRENSVWVIDYKSSSDNYRENREQVESYKQIVGQIYPGKTIEGYLLYLDTGELRQV